MTTKRKKAPKEIRWNPGYRSHHGADPTAVYDRLRSLQGRDAKGELLVSRALLDAQQVTSPLHAIVTWDVNIAAKKYQEIEIRRAIGALREIWVEEDGTETEHRAFVNVCFEPGYIGEKQSPYYFMSDAMQSEETRSIVLEKAKNDLRAWRARYAELRELAEIFEVIDRMP